MADIKVGDLFPSYSDFEKRLKIYKEKNFVEFYVSDSRTLESARKRCPNLIERVPEALKYYYLKLKCVHGGCFKAKKENQGVRKTSTLKQDCKAYIYLKVDDTNCNLIVSKIDENHNHSISKALFNHLPQQRRLSPGTKLEVFELLEMKANKKMVQERVLQTTGKLVTLRDLSNVSVTGKSGFKKSLNQIVDDLTSQYDCDVELLIDVEDNFKAVFIQDSRMKAFYEAYPEFICADSTYKLIDIRTPVLVLMAEDGNGQSEVVAMGFVEHEDKETLKWFFETFRSKSESIARQTLVVMTDKDMGERNVIKEVFPDAYLRICLFHALRAFNREVTCQKMGITPAQRDLVKKIFEKLCYVSSFDDYQAKCQELKDVAEESVWNYFDANWNCIKEEWSSIPSANIGSYLNTTNNRLESFNSKLKSVCDHFSSLDKFVHNLFIVIRSLRNERDHSASNTILKVPTKPLANAEEEIFFHILTPYAFTKVIEQLEASETVVIENVAYNVNETMCNCKFKFSMCLPCKHIFAFRKNNDLPIFDDNLYSQRWTRRYFYDNLYMLKGELREKISEESVQEQIGQELKQKQIETRITVMENKKSYSVNQKYRKAVNVMNKLAAIAAETSQVVFERRLKVLENIYQKWSEGKEFDITEVVGGTSPNPKQEETTIARESNITISGSSDLVKHIKMPSKVKMRGRPKGATLKVVGLPRKKKGCKINSNEKK